MQKRTSTIIATVALVVAVLGSTPLGRAAGNFVLARNSVGTPQLKNNAVIGSKVKDGSLTGADFRAGSLPAGPKGDPGAAGAQGPKGDTGDKGDTGAPGTSGRRLVVGSANWNLVQGQPGTASASCPAGEKVLGGGFDTSSGVFVSYSGPDATSTVWSVKGTNSLAAVGWIQAFAVCATVS